MLEKVTSLTKDSVTEFINDDAMTGGAALAFYSALSLAPLVLLFVSLAGFMGEGAQESIVREFTNLVGKEGGQSISMIIDSADKDSETGLMATIISFSVLAFSASAVFAQLQDVLNRIFGVKAKPGGGIMDWLRRRVFSIGILFSLGLDECWCFPSPGRFQGPHVT